MVRLGKSWRLSRKRAGLHDVRHSFTSSVVILGESLGDYIL